VQRQHIGGEASEVVQVAELLAAGVCCLSGPCAVAGLYATFHTPLHDSTL
jgi:hypothetical protein